MIPESEAVNQTTDNTMTNRKRKKGQSPIYKILHRKQKIGQHEPHALKAGCVPEGLAVPALLVKHSRCDMKHTNYIYVKSYIKLFCL